VVSRTIDRAFRHYGLARYEEFLTKLSQVVKAVYQEFDYGQAEPQTIADWKREIQSLLHERAVCPVALARLLRYHLSRR